MIGYLGPTGTFSHLAAVNVFGENADLKEYATIYSVIRAVEKGEIEKGIVPIENSIEGGVNATLDTLAFDVNLYIIDEYVLKIQQNLLVKKGTRAEDIRTVSSHTQALGQCSKMLSDKFAGVNIKYAQSTAEAGKAVSEGDGSVAAIGSVNCAAEYGLEILLENCGDEDNNSTRFVVIGKKPSLIVTDNDKSSIVFTLENKPGSLYNALELFNKSNLNLLKIESRPLKKELGKYIFFVDVEGNIDNPTIYFALDSLRRSTSFYKFLGSYKMYPNK